MTITIGSLFSGIGGFELGLERGIPESQTIWQVEENPFCQSILKKHWPNSQLFDDVRQVGVNLPRVDIICGGFPCQDISIAGKRGGIYAGRKSSLWWEMWRIIGLLVPQVAIIENVPALTFRDGGGWTVMSSLAKIGFDAEWVNISARDFGAPHKRERIFIVAYPNNRLREKDAIRPGRKTHLQCSDIDLESPHSHSPCSEKHSFRSRPMGEKDQSACGNCQKGRLESPHSTSTYGSPDGYFCCAMEKESGNKWVQASPNRSGENGGMESQNYWAGFPNSPRFCRRDDGISNRVARLKALGNAIVPQCSEWIGRQVYESGLLS